MHAKTTARGFSRLDRLTMHPRVWHNQTSARRQRQHLPPDLLSLLWRQNDSFTDSLKVGSARRRCPAGPALQGPALQLLPLAASSGLVQPTAATSPQRQLILLLLLLFRASGATAADCKYSQAANMTCA
eukprot:GHRQ01013835.1.p2 GENE.GHRQ01013835.1~~GHRQ01013835.1.p2  ORF type:complete len:129 (-),score=21.41 GHRQ01013835.1:246-632(-)